MSTPYFPLLALNRLRMETDGEGVTTLVAGAGCPLDCKYCINADALKGAAKGVTPEELYEQVRIDDLYFQATCGGLTFGGGESLLHVAVIRRMRELCGDRWHLYAETSLAVEPEAVRAAAQVLDGFIVDIKTTDPALYAAYTGKDACALVLDNLKLLLREVGPERILVRVPLIPGFTTEAQQQASAALLRELGVQRLDLFPYILPEQRCTKHAEKT